MSSGKSLLWKSKVFREGRQRDAMGYQCRDDVNHKGEKIDWGQWAITGDDPDFGGTGNPDTGDDYGPAPGALSCTHRACSGWRTLTAYATL